MLERNKEESLFFGFNQIKCERRRKIILLYKVV
jgi:hypothetical protein